MTRQRGGAMHQAELLQNEILRLDERRRRQVSRAEGAYRLDLLALIDGKPDWLLDMVQTSMDNDVGDPAVAMSLRRARHPLRVVDAHEIATEPPGSLEILESEDLPRPPPLPNIQDGNEAWGMPVVTDPGHAPAEAPPAAPVYRYPEPGEPCRVLDDGVTVVAVDP